MDNRPVGIFDSGLGGLTAVTALRALLPGESIVYFGDNGRNPYGLRSVQELRRMAQEDLELAASFNAKAVIAACGTVSSVAGDVLANFRLPVFNVLDASTAKIAKTPGDAPLGVIATSASIKNGAFERRLRTLCPGREIVAAPCQDFVRLIESGHTSPEDEALRESVEESLAVIKERGVCALLLGCTHFGVISEAISAYLGAEVELVDAAACAAGSMAEYLIANDMCAGRGEESYYTSGDPASFEHYASALLGYSISGKVGTAQAGGAETEI